MDCILAVKGVSKFFPGVKALQDIDLEIERGEIHGLVGENGAGKSTLIKVLCGAYTADKGTVELNGQPIAIKTPLEASKLGISVVHQELKLVESLTVKENIFLGRAPKTSAGLIDWKRMTAEAKRLVDELGVDIDVDTDVVRLTVAQKQIIEICKVLSTNAKFIVMDEPSAVLTPSEMETLYSIIHKLKADGITILYISHRLDEIFDLCDRVTVLRDGKKIDTLPMAEVTRTKLISMMVGRELGMEYPKERVEIGEVILSVKNLSRGKVLKDVSFEVRRGEIVGFAGLVGAGRTEVARAIMGADRGAVGEITFKGKPYKMKDVPDAIASGLGLISEDRKKEGLVMSMSVKQNLSLVNIKSIMSRGVLSFKREEDIAERYIGELRIATPDAERDVVYLSGGNQQKVVIGKWLNADCDLFIVDEPTRGIDVGSKAEIYHILCELIRQGKAIIMISSEMPEILGMCDRIYVMHHGRIAGELSAEEATQDRILDLAID